MRLIVSAVLWEKTLLAGMSQRELVRIAADYGCAGVEFRPYWHDLAAELPAIRQELKKHSLLSTYACNEYLLGASEEAARLSLTAMKQSLSLARQLNAGVLRINVAAQPFDRGLLENSRWQQSVAELLELAAAARIVLTLENPPDPAGGDPAFIQKIIASFASPWLKAAFDTGNWLPAGHHPARALEILGGEVGYVHLKDMTGRPGSFTGCHLGAGITDLLSLVGQLTRLGYRGLYALEFPGGPNPAALIQASLKYLGLRQERI